MAMSFYAAKLDPVEKIISPIDGNFDNSLEIGSGNAGWIVETLGFEIDGGIVDMPIDEFIAACEKHLAAGVVSPEIPNEDRSHPGRCTFIQCGVEEGYLERKIAALLKIAKAGKAKGATLMTGA